MRVHFILVRINSLWYFIAVFFFNTMLLLGINSYPDNSSFVLILPNKTHFVTNLLLNQVTCDLYTFCKLHLFSLNFYYLIGVSYLILFCFFFYLSLLSKSKIIAVRRCYLLLLVYLVVFYSVNYLLCCSILVNFYASSLNAQSTYALLHTVISLSGYFIIYFIFLEAVHSELYLLRNLFLKVYNYFFLFGIGLFFGCLWTFFNDYSFIFWNWDFIEIFFLDYLFWWFLFYHFFLVTSLPLRYLLLFIINIIYFRFSILTSSHHMLQTVKSLYLPERNQVLLQLSIYNGEHYYIFVFSTIILFLLRVHHTSLLSSNMVVQTPLLQNTLIIYYYYFYSIFFLSIYYLWNISIFFFYSNYLVPACYSLMVVTSFLNLKMFCCYAIVGVLALVAYLHFKYLYFFFLCLIFRYYAVSIFSLTIPHLAAFLSLLTILNVFFIFKATSLTNLYDWLFFYIKDAHTSALLGLDTRLAEKQLWYTIIRVSDNFFFFSLVVIVATGVSSQLRYIVNSNRIFLLRFYFVC